MVVLQAREAEIRTELDAQAKRPPGRPPRFASPVAKRRRRGDAASSDGEEEEEGEDPVEDAGGWHIAMLIDTCWLQ